MKVILFGALCVAASFALASSSTHRCCDLYKTSLQTSAMSECNEAKCQTAFSDLTKQTPSIMFYDACRANVANPFPLIENLTNCGQSAVNRSYTGRDHKFASEAVQNAIFTLAYGCINKAKTSHCNKSVRAVLRPKNGLLGYTTAITDPFFKSVQFSLVNLLKQCTQPLNVSFAGSEWDSGMASCYHVGEDRHQAPLSGYSTTSIVDEGPSDEGPGVHMAQASGAQVDEDTGECPECSIGSGSSEVPFCADFFSSQGTRRFGANCGERSLVQDRIAQAFHTMWFRTGTAKIHQTAVNITTTSKRCSNYLRQLVCQTTLGQCSRDGKSIDQVCASVCENELTAGCGLSSMAATQACEGLGATRAVTASCPAATATAELMEATENVTKQAAAAINNEVVPDSSGAQARYINVTLCIDGFSSANQTKDGVIAIMNAFTAGLCLTCGDISGTIIMGGEDCTYFYTCRMGPTTLTPATVRANFTGVLQSPPPPTSNKLTVSTTMVPVNQLQSSTTATTSGSSVIVGSWMLLVSAVLAVLF